MFGTSTLHKKHILYVYVKQRASGNFLYDSGNSNWGSMTTQKSGMGGGGRVVKRKGTYIYLWLIHVDI